MEQLKSTLTYTETDFIESKIEPVDPKVLSSVIISTKLAEPDEDALSMDPHARLLELTHSESIKLLLDTASVYSKNNSLSIEDSLKQLISNFREIDKLWDRVLLAEGLNRLSSQFH
ncbi:MAG: hypothetical protein M9962_04720 [Oligoflexia bacterium]|nr:hypothetical protein [Oligoflexia bacterium]